jgi:hypothetical protein
MVVRTLQTIGRSSRKNEDPPRRSEEFNSYGMIAKGENNEILVYLVGPRRDGYHNRRVAVGSLSGPSKSPPGGISPIMGVPPGCMRHESIVESPARPRLFASAAEFPRAGRPFDLASVGRMIA